MAFGKVGWVGKEGNGGKDALGRGGIGIVGIGSTGGGAAGVSKRRRAARLTLKIDNDKVTVKIKMKELFGTAIDLIREVTRDCYSLG